MKASVCLPVVSNRDAHVFVPPHHLVPHNCSTNFAPPKKEAKTIFNNTHTGENFAIIHVYVCVCSQLHWGEASLFTYLEESLLFNLSSVKLTYCPPLTAHVWPIQTLPRVVVCAYRYLTDTHTHTLTQLAAPCVSQHQQLLPLLKQAISQHCGVKGRFWWTLSHWPLYFGGTKSWC